MSNNHTLEDRGDQSISNSSSGHPVSSPKRVLKRQETKPKSLWLKIESSFNIGIHFWEVDKGKEVYWGAGVCSCESGIIVNDTALCFNADSGCHVPQTHDTDESTVDLTSGFRKIGVYLDCERNLVSFYKADGMTPLVPGLYLDGNNA